MKARRLLLLAVAMTGILALAPVGLRAQGSKPPASTEPQWKDRAEYDLYDAISKDATPQTKLEKLIEWRDYVSATDFPSVTARKLRPRLRQHCEKNRCIQGAQKRESEQSQLLSTLSL